MAVITVESAVKYSFDKSCVETSRKGQYKAELTLSPFLYANLLITAITAIQCDVMTVQYLYFLPTLPTTFQTQERSLVKASVKKGVAQTTAKVARNVEVKL